MSQCNLRTSWSLWPCSGTWSLSHAWSRSPDLPHPSAMGAGHCGEAAASTSHVTVLSFVVMQAFLFSLFFWETGALHFFPFVNIHLPKVYQFPSYLFLVFAFFHIPFLKRLSYSTLQSLILNWRHAYPVYLHYLHYFFQFCSIDSTETNNRTQK